MANTHFINVSMHVTNAASYPPGLLPWSSGDVVLIWGTGLYPGGLDLEQFKSDDLKVVIVDADTGPWGFISVSQMGLLRFQ